MLGALGIFSLANIFNSIVTREVGIAFEKKYTSRFLGIDSQFDTNKLFYNISVKGKYDTKVEGSYNSLKFIFLPSRENKITLLGVVLTFCGSS